MSTTGDFIDFFMWISHGENISSKNNYYPYETKFKYITYYSSPYSVIFSTEFTKLMEDPCKLLLGSCPVIPIQNSVTNKKTIFIPPMLFSFSLEDNPEVNELIGLYYYRIQKTGVVPFNIGGVDLHKHECSASGGKILTITDLVQKHGNNANITFSTVTGIVNNECRIRALNPENVALGIFSCQVLGSTYIDRYRQDITSDLVPTIIIKEEGVTIISDPTDFTGMNITPTFIPLIEPLPPGWKTLAGIRTQGCALNTLSFYKLIDENYAREQTVCLTEKGTSIFKIVDYINTFFINNESFYSQNFFKDYGKPNYFVIFRFPIIRGITFLLTNLIRPDIKAQLGSVNGSAIIFKVYTTLGHQGELSHIGHSVSFYLQGNNLWYIDPQSEQAIGIPLTEGITVDHILSSLQLDHYYTYIDIIFNDTIKEGITLEYVLSLEDVHLVSKTPKTTHGGKKHNIKSKIKHNIKRNTKRNIKCKTKRNTKRKTKHNTKFKYSQKGGTIDEFERLSLELDNKNNTPSLLVHVEI